MNKLLTNKRGIALAIAIIETAVIVILSLCLFVSARNNRLEIKDELTLHKLIPEEIDSNTYMIGSSPIALPRGSYTAKFTHNSSTRNIVYISCSDIDSITSSPGILDSHSASGEIHFDLSEDVNDLSLIFYTTDYEELSISDVSISSDTRNASRILTSLILLFVFIDFIIYWFSYISTNKLVSAILLLAVIIPSVALLFNKMVIGDDMQFHLLRIEGIANELSGGHFPARMYQSWAYGHGYPTGIYYGDWVLYFPAILRLTGFSVMTAWKLYILSTNILTVIIAYICFNKITGNNLYASLMTLAYSTASYRLIDIYVRSSAGEMATFIFIPIIILALYKIYEDKPLDKSYYKNSLLLAIGMAGIICSHILTAEIITIALIITCLILFKKTFRRTTIYCYLLSVVKTVLISASFLIPFVDYYFRVPINANNPDLMKSTADIQSSGAHIGDYFRVLGNYYEGYNKSHINLTPGLILLSVLIIGIIVLFTKKRTKTAITLVILSLFFMFVSTNLFPWEAATKIVDGVRTLQFPWRFLILTVILLTLLMGQLLTMVQKEYLKRVIVGLCVICSFITCITFVNSYINNDRVSGFYMDEGSLPSRVDKISGGEYTIQGTDMDNLTCDIITIDDTTVFPVFNYPYYKIIDESGNEYPIVNGPNNCIATHIPAGSDNLKVVFSEPPHWRIAEIVSIASIIGVLFIYNKEKARKEPVQ